MGGVDLSAWPSLWVEKGRNTRHDLGYEIIVKVVTSRTFSEQVFGLGSVIIVIKMMTEDAWSSRSSKFQDLLDRHLQTAKRKRALETARCQAVGGRLSKLRKMHTGISGGKTEQGGLSCYRRFSEPYR